MTSSPQDTQRAPRVPLRIRVDDGDPQRPLHGAWWPQSHDLQTECADLIDQFPELHGRVSRLLFSRPDWDAGDAPFPRSIDAGPRRVKAGSFPGDDTHEMVVVLSSRARLRLLVIPSETERGLAQTLMNQASDGRNRRTAGELLAKVRTTGASVE